MIVKSRSGKWHQGNHTKGVNNATFTFDRDIASEEGENSSKKCFWFRGRFKKSEEGFLKSEGGLCALGRVFNASEGV